MVVGAGAEGTEGRGRAGGRNEQHSETVVWLRPLVAAILFAGATGETAASYNGWLGILPMACGKPGGPLPAWRTAAVAPCSEARAGLLFGVSCGAVSSRRAPKQRRSNTGVAADCKSRLVELCTDSPDRTRTMRQRTLSRALPVCQRRNRDQLSPPPPRHPAPCRLAPTARCGARSRWLRSRSAATWRTADAWACVSTCARWGMQGAAKGSAGRAA